MQAIKLLLLAIVVASVSFSCSKESTDTLSEGLNPTEYYEELNISYGSDDGQKFDLYLPKNRNASTKTMILYTAADGQEATR